MFVLHEVPDHCLPSYFFNLVKLGVSETLF